MNITKYLSEIGRKGGKAKSRAKLAAARANGKLGGRPKKPKRAARLPNTKVSSVIVSNRE
jgi:DNA invertase Pin-like site-specific DNA recombinase